jgi:acetoin utilization deacetylase AcuC-like enzyme
VDIRWFEPPAADAELSCCVHISAVYVTQIMEGTLSATEVRRIGFPWSPQMVERSRRAAGATVAAAHQALHDGVAISLAGGTHHACVGHGEGYCVFNDSAVAGTRITRPCGLVKRVLVVDLDVHQGNGTADIMAPYEWCYTFSMHGAKNYPFRKVASDCDIDLPDGTTDDEYLTTLAAALIMCSTWRALIWCYMCQVQTPTKVTVWAPQAHQNRSCHS